MCVCVGGGGGGGGEQRMRMFMYFCLSIVNSISFNYVFYIPKDHKHHEVLRMHHCQVLWKLKNSGII